MKAHTIDTLTGLGRRGICESFVQTCIKTGKPFMVLFVDLNNLKEVNDEQGHAVGDKLLQQVALTLRLNTRPGDLVIRLGGDEFVVVLMGEVPPLEASTRIAVIIDKVARSYGASAAVGAANYPKDGQDFTVLLDVADRAMYTDKRSKKKKERCCG